MVPERLSDYPAVIVNVSCKLCTRRGRYKLARLAARFGPDALLDDVLAKLAGNCRYWHPKPRRYDPRCGARFEDLDRLPLPDVTADGPLHRQRQPAREDVPQPRRTPMLSDWTAPRIAVVCEACRLRDVFETATIRYATVGDVKLDDLRRSLAARCPKMKAGSCGARLEADGYSGEPFLGSSPVASHRGRAVREPSPRCSSGHRLLPADEGRVEERG